MHFMVRKLPNTILDDEANEYQKENALIFIRNHMAEALQIEFLAKEDPKSKP